MNEPFCVAPESKGFFDLVDAASIRLKFTRQELQMKQIMLTAGLFLGGLSLGSVSSAETLREVLDKALPNNPQVLASLSRYRAETENADATWGRYLPSVDIATGLGKQKRFILSAPDNENNDVLFTRKEASLSVKQSLFSGMNTSNSVDQARNRSKAEFYRLQNTLQEVSLRIIDAYLKVLERRDMIELATENLEMHDDIYHQIQKRAAQGVARSSDLAQIEGRRARANANLINARNNLVDAESEYQNLVGALPLDLEQPGSWKLNLPETLESALEKAIQSHPNALASNLKSVHPSHSTNPSKAAFCLLSISKWIRVGNITLMVLPVQCGMPPQCCVSGTTCSEAEPTLPA